MYGFAYKPKNDCSYASIENSRRRRENFDDLEVVPGDCPGLENSFCRIEGDVVVNVGKNPPDMENVVPCRREKLCVKEIKNKKGVPRQCCFTGVDTGWTDKNLPDCSTMSEPINFSRDASTIFAIFRLTNEKRFGRNARRPTTYRISASRKNLKFSHRVFVKNAVKK